MAWNDLYMQMKTINRSLAALKILTGDECIRTMPQGISFQNTLACNLRCPHCQTHGTEKDRMYFNGIRMSQEMLYQVAHEVLPTADEYLFTVSGEPLTTPNMNILLREFSQYAAKIEMHTNGTLITPEILVHLLPAAKGIHVSIDGATPFVLEATRKGAKYDRLMHNIRLLTRSVELLPDHMRPMIYFGCTIMASNVRELSAMVELAHLLGVHQVYGYFVVIYHNALRQEDIQLHKALYNACRQQAVDTANRLGVYLCIPPAFEGVVPSMEGPLGGSERIIERFPKNYPESVNAVHELKDLVDVEKVEKQATQVRDQILGRLKDKKLFSVYRDMMGWSRQYIGLKRLQRYYHRTLRQHKTTLEEALTYEHQQAIKFCESLYRRIYLSPTGEVIPCCYIYHPLGDASNECIGDIWNGEAYRNFRAKFLSENPPKECIGCHNISWVRPVDLARELC
uniref:Radical SAM/SPASM domain-containing protein n=1 Tax=Desulfatirhabdium butyrativorans TaxID=340467 RepID=A0A7C4RRG0_9BACT